MFFTLFVKFAVEPMAETVSVHFFQEKRSISQVKAELLPRLLAEWGNTCLSKKPGTPSEALLFADLNAGQGLSEETEPYAVARVLESITLHTEQETGWKTRIHLYLHDVANTTSRIKARLESEAVVAAHVPEPKFLADEESLQQFREQYALSLPTLLYLDPFGNELGQQLLWEGTQQQGADFLMIFNASRLGSNLLAGLDASPLGRLLGSRLSPIENLYLNEKASRKRERFFLTKLEEALQEKGYWSVIFKINFPHKDQAHQYCFFASQQKEVYFALKEMLSLYSDMQADGVPMFSVNHAEKSPVLPGFQKYLHAWGIENLADELAEKRADYHYLSVQEIFEDHSPGTPYIKSNYKAAFSRLRNQGRLSVVDAQNKRMQTIEDHSIIFYKLHGLAK